MPYWATFMMFWWHAMAAMPHLHRPLPVWLRFLYLIVGGEVANMITGVTLAFRPGSHLQLLPDRELP